MSKPTKKQIQQEIDRLKAAIDYMESQIVLKKGTIKYLESEQKKAKE